MIKIRDANITITDRLMTAVYDDDAIDKATVSLLNDPQIFQLNILSTPEKVFSLLAPLSEKPFFICGSSNFHHLDAYSIALRSRVYGVPLQLVLIDRHMDCTRYDEAENILHCGNWISYCYQKKFIDKIVMVGCDDHSKIPTFDSRPKEEGNFLHLTDFGSADLSGFLENSRPTYISIDTDVLNVPSDWGLGRHSLETVLASPIWGQLEKQQVIGCFINGHVTDARRFKDALACSIRYFKNGSGRLSMKEAWFDTIYTLRDKLTASLSGAPLMPHEQLLIVSRLYEKVADTMRKSASAF